jgi:hypothetical protein
MKKLLFILLLSQLYNSAFCKIKALGKLVSHLTNNGECKAVIISDSLYIKAKNTPHSCYNLQTNKKEDFYFSIDNNCIKIPLACCGGYGNIQLIWDGKFIKSDTLYQANLLLYHELINYPTKNLIYFNLLFDLSGIKSLAPNKAVKINIAIPGDPIQSVFLIID